MVPADQIIIVTVPDQGVRTDDIRLSIVPQDLLLPAVEVSVEEGDLLAGIDRFIDGVNDVITLFVTVTLKLLLLFCSNVLVIVVVCDDNSR